jgi:dTDP-4-dehydrorhamnose 3,5-epimerase-like enzyme
VIYDMREGSASFGESLSFELDDVNFGTIFIPAGFAHGYQALSNETIVSYSVKGAYMPNMEIRLDPLSDKFIEYWTYPFLVGGLDKKSVGNELNL